MSSYELEASYRIIAEENHELRATIASLRDALNAALDALKAAPEPCWYDSQTPGVNKYRKWHNGPRQDALKEEE